MKPRGYNYDTDVVLLGIGTAHAVADTAGDQAAGKLIVPEAESQTGWRDYWVAKPGADAPARRSLGFRKPGER